MAQQGTKLGSSWASDFAGFGVHLPRQAIIYGDTDAADQAIWEDWWFEAAGLPGGGQAARSLHQYRLRRV